MCGPEVEERPASRLGRPRPVQESGGWIDVPICEAILTKDVKILCCVDGSATSMAAFHYVSEGLLQMDRTSYVMVLHIYDDSKTYLSRAHQREPLRQTCETLLTGCAAARRFHLKWVPKESTTQKRICQAICEMPADYVVMGFYGLKGKKKEVYTVMGHKLSTNVFHALTQGNSCSLVCLKDEETNGLPIRQKKGIFVVSASLNKSSTKAFLDALRLSKPGDEIHVVYVRGFMESDDSDYTVEIRAKYESFFAGLRDAEQQVFSTFQDRDTRFVMLAKQRRETTPQSVVRYAEDVGADFLVVGANAVDRVARGKQPVGSVSLQMCLLWDRNFIVANWIDVDPRVYDESVRRARTPSSAVLGPL